MKYQVKVYDSLYLAAVAIVAIILQHWDTPVQIPFTEVLEGKPQVFFWFVGLFLTQWILYRRYMKYKLSSVLTWSHLLLNFLFCIIIYIYPLITSGMEEITPVKVRYMKLPMNVHVKTFPYDWAFYLLFALIQGIFFFNILHAKEVAVKRWKINPATQKKAPRHWVPFRRRRKKY